uniref:Conotoxin n=1 Tax=Conus praecellens TaxID=128530 RepID=A0A291C2X0_CONPC|nr:conotoxin [Conus praecellens]
MNCLLVFFIVLLLIAHSSQVVEHSKLERIKMLSWSRSTAAKIRETEGFPELCCPSDKDCCAVRSKF